MRHRIKGFECIFTIPCFVDKSQQYDILFGAVSTIEKEREDEE